MKRAINPFEYPFVIKQVNEWLTVSVPDLEITVAEQVPRETKINKDYVTAINTLMMKAAKKVLERMMRFEEAGKKAPKGPSFIRQTIQISHKEAVPTSVAAKYLGISEASLKRWELSGVISATKTRGGHRKFNLGELERVKEYITKGIRPPTIEEQDRERLRKFIDKIIK
ncbi:MAG: hypothetical protein ACXVCY_12255 [Pseudobdellovibrionaceae bacterium]